MRKKVALLMCLLLVALSLFGCSQTELEYLQFLKEMGSNTVQGHIEGTFEVSFDKRGLEQMVSELSYRALKTSYDGWYGDEESDVDWEYDFEELYSIWYDDLPNMNYNWNGHRSETETVVVHYTMDLDYNKNIAYRIGLTASVNGDTLDFGDFYYSMEDGIYVSGKTLLSIVNLVGQYDSYSIFSVEEFRQGLDQLVNKNQYLYLKASGNEYQMMESLARVEDMQNLSEYAYTMVTEAFSGFSTGFVEKNGSNFEITVSLDDILTFIPKGIDYILSNETVFYDAVEAYIQAMEEYSFERYGYGYMFDQPEPYTLDQEMREEFSWFLEEAKEFYDTYLSADWFKDMEGAYLKYTLGKNQNSYVYGAEGQFVYKENELISVNADYLYTPTAVKVTMPKNIMDEDSIYEKALELEQSLNPVSRVSLSWEKDFDWDAYWNEIYGDYDWYDDYDYDWDEDQYWDEEQSEEDSDPAEQQKENSDLTSEGGIVWQTEATSDSDLDLENGEDEESDSSYDDDTYRYDWEQGYEYYYDDTEYLSARYYTKYTGLDRWNYADRDEYQLEFRDGTLYVPLRPLCEKLGVELAWDEELNRSCAVYNGSKVDLEGFVDGGVYYVKARDFEKLGFEVTYDDYSNYYHYVTIERID